MSSCYMVFGDPNLKEVLTFRIKRARQDKSPLLVQVLNIQKSVSVLHILPTLFWRCIDIFPDWTYLDAYLVCFLHSPSLVDPLGKEEVIVCVFQSVGHSSAVNDVLQAQLNSMVEIFASFTLLSAGMDVVYKFLAEGALSPIVREVGVAWCKFSNIPFLWSVLGSSGNARSNVVAWSGLQCWWCWPCSVPRCVGSDPGVADLPLFHCFHNWKWCGGWCCLIPRISLIRLELLLLLKN